MPSKTYRLTPLAEVDLEHIWFDTLQRWSKAQADRYHRDLVATFNALAEGRKVGRESDIRPGYLKYLSVSHMIYFCDRGDRIEIIRVLHAKMDANRHL